jgi:isoleucyl-tRNA synthetase
MNSVHLTTFPKNIIELDEKLINEMDIVRKVCGATLSIRKKNNLRGRLPLSKLTVIGAQSLTLENYKKFIMEETNVKHLILDPNFGKDVSIKLNILFEKAGKKFGKKIPEIAKAAKEGNWKKLSNGSIVIAEEIISPEDFELKLVPTFAGENYESIGSEFLVVLDIEVSKELEMEGIARDFIRAIQNQRRLQKLEVNDKIDVLYYGDEKFETAIKLNTSYIKEQVLAENLILKKNDGTFNTCELENLDVLFKVIKL